MSDLTRRELLKRAVAASPSFFLADALPAQMQMPARVPRELPDPALAFGFVDPLKRLKPLAPAHREKGAAVYRIRMMEATHAMHSTLAPARMWGYEGQYPGPVIEAFRGEHVEVEWENNLPTQHLFKIDPRIHGAMPPAPEVRTVPHLHGAKTASESDGLPEKWFTPGNKARYIYPNDQQAATLWYHDHAVGITRLNVYAGLSGFYLLRDEQERSLNLPEGEYEIPLILQDRTLDEKGQLVYAPVMDDGVPLEPGIWGPEFLGRYPVVNGTICPYLEVEPRPYRLRILNAANTRFFGLQLNLAKRVIDIPQLVNFQQIGSDGGFLPGPVSLNRILLGPAERADLLVDFSGLEGKTVTVTNNAVAPYPGWSITAVHGPRMDELMQFRVILPKKEARAGSGSPVDFSVPLKRYAEADAVMSRDFVLTERMDSSGRSLGVRINEKGYDDPVTETVKLGTMEKWRFINATEDAHPMHLHLVQFQILHRQGFDIGAFRQGNLKPAGALRPPPPGEAGWKDTAVVLPNEMLTILARFEGYTGRFVFHCHMLEHEDNDMMRPYVVVS